jgi:hypothetical protein
MKVKKGKYILELDEEDILVLEMAIKRRPEYEYLYKSNNSNVFSKKIKYHSERLFARTFTINDFRHMHALHESKEGNLNILSMNMNTSVSTLVKNYIQRDKVETIRLNIGGNMIKITGFNIEVEYL